MLALRIALGLALAYVVLVILAWRFQERLAFPAPRAPPPDPQRVGVANGETVEVTMEDGTRLVGWYLKPEVGGGRGRLGEAVPHRSNLPQPPPTSPTSPGLLWFYGNGETIAAIWPIVREFQPPGTAVLVVDYPGYGGSAGRADEGGLYAAAAAPDAGPGARPGSGPDRLYVDGPPLRSGAPPRVGAHHPPA